MKLALAISSFGEELLSGAERYALKLTEALGPLGCELHIFASQAVSPLTWENRLPAWDKVGDAEVRRFPVAHRRLRRTFGLLKRCVFALQRWQPQLYRRWAPRLDPWLLRTQGPWCPNLWLELQAQQSRFDALIAVGYLFAPTFYALQAFSGPRVLIPTAHDEPEFSWSYVGQSMSRASALGFLSQAERQVCDQYWPASRDLPHTMVPPGLEADANQEEPLHQALPERFFLCFGRVERGKGIELLYRQVPQDVRFVVAGRQGHRFAPDPRFLFIGPVSEGQKVWLHRRALALVVPSQSESYSMVTANAIALNCPVIGMQNCEAVEELIIRYGGRLCPPELLGAVLADVWSERIPALERPLLAERIRQERSWTSSAQRLRELLQDLTQRLSQGQLSRNRANQ